MHPLPCLASWLRRLDPWSMIYSTVSKLKICLMPPPHRQFYHFFTSRPFFPPLLSSFQTRCLSASRMAEDNLEMGKGAVGQIWDWSKLISPWLIKTDQKAGSSSAGIQTMDLWEPEGKPWQEWNCFFFPSSKLIFRRIGRVRMCCMRLRLPVQFVHLSLWELGIHGLGWKKECIGCKRPEKAIWAPSYELQVMISVLPSSSVTTMAFYVEQSNWF